MQLPTSFRLPIVVVTEWVLLLPATVFLAAAALRGLQPRQYEPAHISWIIFEWTATHISPLGAALLFLGAPGVVAMAGCVTLLRAWREDQALRRDTILAFSIFRRHLAIAVLTAGLLLAGAIFALAIGHTITD
ncbi:MAG TPA: hypothetical protein VEV17_21360 [Bryobacteraceae bacterium]|nr:hypothetical protein [Bryobacteraceae bacterium]